VRVTRIVPDIIVPDLESAHGFYADYLGLDVEAFNLGWVTRRVSSDTGATVQLVTHDATAAEDPVLSVTVDDVEGALGEAERRGYEIVHPLTTESWGVRRFFVRAPDGTVINMVQDHAAG
jgi:catechol 2,3-dioxygenase-like lactoylglutathione lyase family enzyme